MIFKGTPGPWYAINFSGYWNIMTGDYYESDDTTDSDAVGDNKAEKNAYLQAAAPDLLEALQNLLQLKEWKDKHGKDEHYQQAQPIAWEAAKTAIDKALNYQS